MNNQKEKIIIAHRGASGYLTDHTLEAKAYGAAVGANYLEQDVVMTKDNYLVVLHNHFLNGTCDVSEKFPNRARRSGKYYVIDFTLEELRLLTFSSEFVMENAKKLAKYKNRFPLNKVKFKVHTLEEEIEFIAGLNHSTGKNIGLYVETKAPYFHKKQGRDISLEVLKILKKYGYTKKTDKVFLQSFDFLDLIRVKEQLLPKLNMDINLIQLIGYTKDKETMFLDENGNEANYSFDWMLEKGAIKELSKYVNGIAPNYKMLVDEASSKGNIKLTDLAIEVQKSNLLLHPYTFRREDLPNYAETLEELLDIFYFKLGASGVFTDFPDVALKVLKNN